VDATNHRGATTLLEGTRPEDQPLTIRWQSCGSAAARFVDAEGKPAGNCPVLLWVAEALHGKKAGTMRTAAPFMDVVVTDKDGKATLENLIAGVRYLLLQADGKELKEFTVEQAKRTDLGAVVVDPSK
jgi:hypothetical protein